MPALLLLLLLPCLSFAQPDTTWSRTFLVNDRSSLIDVEIVHDTLIVGVGYAQSGFTNPDLDNLICAYTTSGDSVYARTILETEANESLSGLIVLSGDTMIATGWSLENGRELNLVGFLASTGEVLWERGYALAGRTKGWNLCKLADGRIAVVGYRGGVIDPSHSDVWVLLCEANSDTVWTRAAGGTDTDIGNDILQKPNGNLIIAAQTNNNVGAGGWDIWAIEFDLNGNLIGPGQTFGTTGTETCYNLAVDPFGAYWFIGRSTASGGSGFVGVIPTAGAPYSEFYSSVGYGDTFVDAMPWFGGMLFVGKSGNSGSLTGPFMRAIDSENESRWVWRYGELATDVGFNSVVPRSDGGALAVGSFVMDADTIIRAHLLSIAPPAGVIGTVRSANDGNPVVGARVYAAGASRFAMTDADGVYQLEIAAGTHDLVVSGACIESDTTFGVVVVDNDLTQLDFEVGEPEFQNLQSSVNIISRNETVGSATMILANSGTGSLNFRLSVTALTPPGSWLSVEPAEGVLPPNESTNIVVSVIADTTNDGNYEYFGELTVRSNACPDTVIVLPVLVSVLDVDDRTELPSGFSLSPAYPNPFNSNTSITLALPNETDIRMEVFNIAGKWVQTLVDGPVSAGNHNINIDLSGEASGLYFVRAVTPSAHAVQKLLFVR